MATISLHEYVAQVEALLKQESYEQAITLCQHALRSYPKCAEFYRMLGQACLESERPDDAADMFRRVLGADPQNFVARVGLGVVAEGIGALDEALWQWDRALELEPHHAVVREEWRRVRMQRDKQPPPPRAKLNRTALGYVYLRGEQYDRAAAEFRTVLSGVPTDAGGKHDRFDLQVALAEALYRGGRQREASELCQQVLAALPNALKPNLILGDIYHESGRDADAQGLFQCAQNVDPENAVASRLLNSPVRLPRRNVNIEEPEGSGFLPIASAFARISSPDSASAVPLLGRPRTDAAPAAASADADADANVPDWLKALRAQSPTAAVSTPAAPAAAHEAPDWLKELSAASEAEDVGAATELRALPEPSPAAEESAPANLTPAADTAAALPDWLRQLRGTVPGSEAAAPAEATAPAAPAPAAQTAPDAPDWLANLRSGVPADDEPADEPEAAATSASEAGQTEEVPAWLSELRRPAAEPPAAEVAAAAAPVDALPAWLTLSEESAPAQQAAEADEPGPAWMDETPAAAAAMSAALIETEVESSAPPPSPEPVAPAPIQPVAPMREAVAYLDDANAPRSIETQVAPTGDDEHRARLDLARVMKDIDAESALGLYEMMDGAKDNLRQQAIADVAMLVGTHPRAQDVLDRLRAGETPPAAPAAAAVAAAPEAAGNFDDAAMPPMLEAEVAPIGAGQYAARLDLARMLIDLELDSALDQYEQMEGAGPELLRKAVDDVAILVVAHPESRRAEQVLDHLQRGLPQPAEPLPAPADAELGDETAMPPAPDTSPGLPVVAAESLELDSATTTSGAAGEALPVVDETMGEEPSRPAREPARAPMGTAQFRARLDLARALKFIDVDAALNLYELMVGSTEQLRADAIGDLESLVARYPRAAGIIEELRGTKPAPSAASTLPDWLVEVDTSAPPQGPTGQLEPVVAEEAMEEPLAAPADEFSAETLPIVDETMMEEPAASAVEDESDAIIANAPTAMLDPLDAGVEVEATGLLTGTLVAAEAEAQAVPAEVEPAAEAMPVVDEQLVEAPAPATAEPLAGIVAEGTPIVDEHLIKESSAVAEATPIVDEHLAETPAPDIAEPTAEARAQEPPVVPTEAPETGPQPLVTIEPQAAAPEAMPVVAEESLSAPVAAAAAMPAPAAEPAATTVPAPVPAATPALREGSEFLSDATAPASIESQEAPTGAAEHQARLELARALREIDIHEGAGQYKSLVDEGLLLPDVIADLQGWLKAQPSERVVRLLLAEALTKAGRLPEAVEQYRLLV